MKTISEEIAQVSSAFALTEEEDPLVQTAARLDAFRGNLCYIGYLNRTLWSELSVCPDIVLRFYFVEGQARHGVIDRLLPVPPVLLDI